MYAPAAAQFVEESGVTFLDSFNYIDYFETQSQFLMKKCKDRDTQNRYLMVEGVKQMESRELFNTFERHSAIYISRN